MRAGWLLLCTGACIQSASTVCDDGSLCPSETSCLAGGGCRAASCGDAVVDGQNGEECDDGNSLDHDGCSSICRAERLVWTQAAGADIPPRLELAAAWDADRGRGLVHGGLVQSVSLGDAWSWNGTTWEAAPSGPTAVYGHALTPDGTGQLVLVGGDSDPPNHALLDQCWTWDGAWHASQPVPVPIVEHAMAQDPAGGLIASGGFQPNPPSIKFSPFTLHRDPSGAWTTVETTAIEVYDHAIVFEASGRRVIKTGGLWFNLMAMTQSWTGSAWEQWASELDLARPAVVYDPNRRRLTAIAGNEVNPNGDPGNPTHEIFELVDDDPAHINSWVAINPQPDKPPVPARASTQAFYDALRHAFVLVGGMDSSATAYGETWLLRWESEGPEEACDGTDNDGDGLVRCEDPDCWPRCTPRCQFGVPCNDADPHCGDGVCNAALEDAALCPSDCP